MVSRQEEAATCESDGFGRKSTIRHMALSSDANPEAA